MLQSSWSKLAVASLALVLCAAAIQAWRADHRDRAQLTAELAATKKLLTAADARQRDRDTQLAHTLAAIDAQKRATLTPAQIIQQLQKSIPLPEPIALQATPSSTGDARDTTNRARSTIPADPTPSPMSPASDAHPPKNSHPNQTSVQLDAPSQALIPRADLKPLYHFTLDCQACQARLSVAQSDLADEKAKTAALTKERDEALRVAKGGSAWRRVARAAKWALLGAAAGAIASKAAH